MQSPPPFTPDVAKFKSHFFYCFPLPFFSLEKPCLLSFIIETEWKFEISTHPNSLPFVFLYIVLFLSLAVFFLFCLCFSFLDHSNYETLNNFFSCIPINIIFIKHNRAQLQKHPFRVSHCHHAQDPLLW